MNNHKRPLTGLLLALGLLVAPKAQAQHYDFEYKPDENHSVFIILSEVWAEANEITAEVAKFNQREFGGAQLQIMRYKMPYISKQPVLFVTNLKSEAQALDYYRRLYEPFNKPDFMQMGIVEMAFPISDFNFNQVLLRESLDGYEAFFLANYRP